MWEQVTDLEAGVEKGLLLDSNVLIALIRLSSIRP